MGGQERRILYIQETEIKELAEAGWDNSDIDKLIGIKVAYREADTYVTPGMEFAKWLHTHHRINDDDDIDSPSPYIPVKKPESQRPTRAITAAQVSLRRLQFARWLIDTGRLKG